MAGQALALRFINAEADGGELDVALDLRAVEPERATHNAKRATGAAFSRHRCSLRNPPALKIFSSRVTQLAAAGIPSRADIGDLRQAEAIVPSGKSPRAFFSISTSPAHPSVGPSRPPDSSRLIPSLPWEPNDLPLSLIVTPDEVITVPDPPPAPADLDAMLVLADLDAMPVLADLTRLRRAR